MNTHSAHGLEQATLAIDITSATVSFVQRVRELLKTVRTLFTSPGAAAAPLADPLEAGLPKRIGNWRVLEVLGSGASSTVFRVTPLGSGRGTEQQYALKLQNRRLGSERDDRNRFRRESAILGSVKHRNIVGLIETGEHEGHAFLVMEMVEGMNLREALEKQQPQLKGKLDWAIQICRALAAMHARGIVHRDLKPDNILTTRVGSIKIADFGLARTHETGPVTRAGFLVGTPAYMSPEYLMGREPDTRSDLYSLGVVLYELFTGSLPYQASGVNDFIQAHLDARPIPPRARSAAVPHELQDIILRLLEKSPRRRFQTANEAREALETMLAHLVGVEPMQRRNVA